MVKFKLIHSILGRIGSPARTRAIKFFSESIPFNYSKYKPTGYIDSSTLSSSYDGIESSWHESIHNELRIPSQLYKSTVNFMRLESYHQESGKISSTIAVGAVSVLNGRVYSNSPERVIPFDTNNKVITDVLFHHCQESFKEDYSLRVKFFPKPLRIKGTAVSLLAGGGSGINIAHWMLDVIPRLEQIKKLYPLDKIDKFICPGKEISYKTESLKILGIEREKLIFITSQLVHIEASRMLFATPPRSHHKVFVPEWLTAFHRKYYLRGTSRANGISYPKKIYISRKDSKLRGLDNEPELTQSLKKMGYEEIILSNYSYSERINIVNNANEIVSMSGAGLTFIIFCKPGTKVLEIFPRSFVHYVNYNIAKQCDLRYQYMIANTAGTGTTPREAQRDSIAVNIKKMKDLLNTHKY